MTNIKPGLIKRKKGARRAAKKGITHKSSPEGYSAIAMSKDGPHQVFDSRRNEKNRVNAEKIFSSHNFSLALIFRYRTVLMYGEDM